MASGAMVPSGAMEQASSTAHRQYAQGQWVRLLGLFAWVVARLATAALSNCRS